MKPKLFSLFILSLTFMGCSSSKTPTTNSIQGISGYVYVAKGNQMPMKGAPKKTRTPLLCSVLIYEPTSIADTEPQTATNRYTSIRTKQVASVSTDSTGYFSIQLPVGKYSLFIKQGDGYFANSFDQFNNIALFEVQSAKFTEVKLTVNKAAAY